MQRVEYGTAVQPLIGGIEDSGDIAVVREDTGSLYFALVDVLGHGSEAGEVAAQASQFLGCHCDESLVDQLNGLHEHLNGTRGAVAALCRLNVEDGTLQLAGIGNIAVRVIGRDSFQFVLRDGIIGYGRIKALLQERTISPGEYIVLHSDGIRSFLRAENCFAAIRGSAHTVADNILKECASGDDDASCIVVRYTGADPMASSSYVPFTGRLSGRSGS